MNNYQFRQNLARKLTSLRKENGLFQRQVAKAIGVPLTNYKSYEEGRCEPSTRILGKLKELYRLSSIDEIVEQEKIK